ncbi:VOC family protein [Lentzea albidocapillata]|uniref:Glyoxalase-like domain-containing protein n=1 Tax=Lentzea albidocapillata TaxID=40571 RepID=A0A1W2FQ35_9PSEU|nr:VOC family protein [Lentzea albidocapillata]SMD23884.1 Glyoxalase-like domain-containing protein [Lentzea albidocapillata]
MEIDHVVLAARTKADAEEVLSQAGLGIARGRVIPGLGLSNLVVPLGQGLLEIHYPNGEPLSPGSPPLLDFDKEALATHSSAALVPMAWLVLMEDERRLRELAATNDMSVLEVSAEGPGFPPYALAGFGANFDRRWLPCLIHWPEGPPALSAAHRRQPVGITRIDVAGPAGDIRGWCGGTPRGLNAVPGTAGPLRVEIGFADGTTLTLGLDD